eukprot:SAG22_NODE_54_length_23787_cov_12.917511_2_plen_180_part_00
MSAEEEATVAVAFAVAEDRPVDAADLAPVEHEFVPLGYEAGGALGPATLDFLTMVGKVASSQSSAAPTCTIGAPWCATGGSTGGMLTLSFYLQNKSPTHPHRIKLGRRDISEVLLDLLLEVLAVRFEGPWLHGVRGPRANCIHGGGRRAFLGVAILHVYSPCVAPSFTIQNKIRTDIGS